jgi:hypothetical protein
MNVYKPRIYRLYFVVASQVGLQPVIALYLNNMKSGAKTVQNSQRIEASNAVLVT